MTDANPLPRVDWKAVNARRVQRHHLAAPAPGRDPATVGAVAGALCGAHAQVLAAAEVSLALRLAEGTRQDVQRALRQDATLVRTYGPRGTVHLLPAAELPLWCGALGAVGDVVGIPGPELLTPDRIDALDAALGTLLAEAALTGDELTEALVEEVGPWAGEPVMEAFRTRWPRWRWATHLLAHRGALCFGPNKGHKVTWTSPRRLLPDFAPLPRETAVREMARRYLYGYGPVTAAEFARWLAAPIRWATGVLESLGAEAEQVLLAGDTPAWQLAGDPLPPAGEGPRGVRLLPYFDAFGVGSHPRPLLFPGRAAARALRAGQAGNRPLLLVDGEVAGIWHQRTAGRRVQLTVEPLAPLSAAHRRELAAEAERLGHALGATAELTLGTVTVGPHA